MAAAVSVTVVVIVPHASFVARVLGNTFAFVLRLFITAGSPEALKHTRTSLVLWALC